MDYEYMNMLVARETHLTADLDVDSEEAIARCGAVRSIRTLAHDPLYEVCADCAA